MFNIRSLVNRISQSKETGDTSDASSTKSRTVSQNSSVFAEEAVPVEAEGFLCPACMSAFPSPEDLQTHYESTHMEPGANYLCPVCKARLPSAIELELHFSQNHSASASKHNIEGIDSLKQELSQLSSTLHQEKWQSEELRKEMGLLQEVIKVQGTSEECQMYQQQLQGLQETKSLLTSEVVLLRKQLTEALESMVSLRQERDRMEDRAARHSQSVVELQSSLDESLGFNAALQEQIRGLEAQLSQRATVDDAETLKRELAQVQRVMDESAREKEVERDELKISHQILVNEHNTLKENYASLQQSVEGGNLEVLKQLESAVAMKLRLEDEMEKQKNQMEQLRSQLSEKSDQLASLQRVRDETDVCVSHLRSEVTSLQEMLSSARHRAEGEVSAKENEMISLKMELLHQQQAATRLESRCQLLDKSTQQLTLQLEAKGRTVTEREDQMRQLEESVSRLEREKASS